MGGGGVSKVVLFLKLETNVTSIPLHCQGQWNRWCLWNPAGSRSGIITHSCLALASELPVTVQARRPCLQSDLGLGRVHCHKELIYTFNIMCYTFNIINGKFLRLSWTEASSWFGPRPIISLHPGLMTFTPSCLCLDLAVNARKHDKTVQFTHPRHVRESPRTFQLPLIQHWMWPTFPVRTVWARCWSPTIVWGQNTLCLLSFSLMTPKRWQPRWQAASDGEERTAPFEFFGFLASSVSFSSGSVCKSARLLLLHCCTSSATDVNPRLKTKRQARRH